METSGVFKFWNRAANLKTELFLTVKCRTPRTLDEVLCSFNRGRCILVQVPTNVMLFCQLDILLPDYIANILLG